MQNKIKVKGRANLSTLQLDRHMFVYINARADLFRQVDEPDSKIAPVEAQAIRRNVVQALMLRSRPLIHDAQRLWALCRLPAEALALATASDMPLAVQGRGPAATAADLAAQINPTVTHARQEAAEWAAALDGSDPMAVDEEAAGGNAAA